MLRSLALALVLSLLAPLSVFAQAAPSTESLTITLSPSYPRPYDTVTVTVTSSVIDLAAATVRIYANGALVEEGLRSAQIRLGGPGSRTTVRVSASDAQSYEKTMTIVPGEVSLIVEPVATAQPLYQGASLVPSEGQVRIIALADLRTAPSARIPNNQVAYTWKLGNQTLLAESGLGRSVLTATAPARYRDALITVTATNQAKTVSAQSSVTISPSDPIVRIYESDPLGGINFSKALTGTFTLTGSEETFRMVPFFFRSLPSIEWTLNGNVSGSSEDITVRSSSGSGTALLGVAATGAEARANAGVTLRFGAGTTGIFGR